jgi:hypothetical protein
MRWLRLSATARTLPDLKKCETTDGWQRQLAEKGSTSEEVTGGENWA